MERITSNKVYDTVIDVTTPITRRGTTHIIKGDVFYTLFTNLYNLKVSKWIENYSSDVITP